LYATYVFDGSYSFQVIDLQARQPLHTFKRSVTVSFIMFYRGEATEGVLGWKVRWSLDWPP